MHFVKAMIKDPQFINKQQDYTLKKVVEKDVEKTLKYKKSWSRLTMGEQP